jgi:mannose-6-phosphate isomerase
MDPLVFEPFLRPQIWGGRRLARLNKPLPTEGQFGESWEISGHPLHISRVAEGPLQGCLLSDLDSHLLYGDRGWDQFPLLLKFLDCRVPLSVQVHPNDEAARELLGSDNGKTEAWIILDADPGARLYAGLKRGVTRADVERALRGGTIVDCLHSLSPRPGDCILIPAGQVHAIGGGVLLAEIQQTSDATFRLFDWNRTGPDGSPRQLHQEQSLRCMDWLAGPVHPAEPVALTGFPTSIRGERLAVSPYFEIERFCLQDDWTFTGSGEFSIWTVLNGEASLAAIDGSYSRHFSTGESLLVPASSGVLRWTPAPTATVLGIRALQQTVGQFGMATRHPERPQYRVDRRSAFSVPVDRESRRAA